MREIKFRAWHKALKKILSLDEWHHYGARMISGELKSDDHFIMQYTGLKDKNGKEIYEGDILNDIFKSGIIQEVIYEQDMFLVKGSGVRLSLYASKDSIEIIGNIHENPELLTP